MVLGGPGAGKSSLGNSLLGWRLGAGQGELAAPFRVGHGVEAATTQPAYSSGAWLGLEVQLSTRLRAKFHSAHTLFHKDQFGLQGSLKPAVV